MNTLMENIALSDSNDDLVDEIIDDHRLFRPPVAQQDEQQKVASELQDAANTDVTKPAFSANSTIPFKPLFPAPNQLGQGSIGGSPLVFQPVTSGIPSVNPLLQPPMFMQNTASPSIQTNIHPMSAFTPLVPTNNSPSVSLIQPKLTIGNQQAPFMSPAQPVQFPIPTMTNTFSPETTNVSHGPHETVKTASDSHFSPLPPPPSHAIRETNPPPAVPPPPTMTSSNTSINPYSARASLSERIYPSMPTSSAPLQPQQLPPPVSFQQQSTMMVQPPSNLFVPPTSVPTSNVPMTNQGVETNMYAPVYQPPGNPDVNPWNDYSTPAQAEKYQDQGSNNSNGLWGWFSNNKMIATVVERAKTSIETVITTVDPQMKQYIQPGQEIHLVVTSAKDVKLTPVRDAFTHVFGRVTTQGIGVQSNVAPQPVGFEAGFKGAQQRIENLRRQNVVRPDQCVVSIENFIAELVPDMYFDLGYVLLSDPMNSIELHLFTQAIPVPTEYVFQARDRTPADYPLKWSGYMVTVGEMLHAQMPFINPEDWHETLGGTSRRDIIYATCKSLAYMYKQRLDRNQS